MTLFFKNEKDLELDLFVRYLDKETLYQKVKLSYVDPDTNESQLRSFESDLIKDETYHGIPYSEDMSSIIALEVLAKILCPFDTKNWNDEDEEIIVNLWTSETYKVFRKSAENLIERIKNLNSEKDVNKEVIQFVLKFKDFESTIFLVDLGPYYDYDGIMPISKFIELSSGMFLHNFGLNKYEYTECFKRTSEKLKDIMASLV